MKFQESKLAHKYCHGKGIELGAAAHNPFGLENCLNIAPKDDEEFFKKSQIDMCNDFIPIDLYGDAAHIPMDDSSCDYIISSHVVEHVPDLISAFLEWNRVLKKDGIIFMIFPKREALQSDIGRPLSTLDEFQLAYDTEGKYNIDKAISNHVWVFSLESMMKLINYCNKEYNLQWELIDYEETDSKVGNGHTVVCRRYNEN